MKPPSIGSTAPVMKPESSDTAHADVCLDRFGRVAVAAVVAGLLLFGVWPNRLLEVAKTAADSVHPPAAASPPAAHPTPGN